MTEKLNNIIIFDEISNAEILGLYSQCDFGLVFLDPRHKTHNIPGKFISYMHCGLPVLACINKGNDLLNLINSKELGIAFVGYDSIKILSAIEEMINNPDYAKKIPDQCRTLARERFSVVTAVQQIADTFTD